MFVTINTKVIDASTICSAYRRSRNGS